MDDYLDTNPRLSELRARADQLANDLEAEGYDIAAALAAQINDLLGGAYTRQNVIDFPLGQTS
jgi:outer membrane murein-binding lipoprotein Lpp